MTLPAVRAIAAVPTVTLDQDTAPTPERLAQAGLTVAMQIGTGCVQIVGSAAVGIVSADGLLRPEPAPLDRLHARGRLDGDPDRNRQLHEAGARLRHHHHRSGLSGFPTVATNPALSGGDPSQREAITEAMESGRRALRRAEAAMHPGDWHAVHAVVIEELTLEAVGQDLGFGNRAAAASVTLDRLRRGLGQLAELWGLLAPAEPANGNAPRSAGARVTVGPAAPHRSAARGYSCARSPIGTSPDRSASKASIRRGNSLS